MIEPDPRAYPDRPYLAVSAAIIREGKVLLVRRAKPTVSPVYTLPGGVVEAGETLHEAVKREIGEETGLTIEPLALAGHREFLLRDTDLRVARHFVILCFASRWIAGEPILNEELAEFLWLQPEEVAALNTTERLAEIVLTAAAQVSAADAT